MLAVHMVFKVNYTQTHGQLLHTAAPDLKETGAPFGHQV